MARLCTVRGRLVGANQAPLLGKVVFVPNRISTPTPGTVMLRQPIQVDLGGDGSFTIQLTPSTEVGQYTVRTPAGALVIEVPDAPSARFDDILVQRR